MFPTRRSSSGGPRRAPEVRRASGQADDPDPTTRKLFWLAAGLAVAAAIGLLVAGLLDMKGADADAESVRQTIRRQQLAATVESHIGVNRGVTLRSGAALAEASALHDLAKKASAAGDPRQAAALAREADLVADVAARRLEAFPAGIYGAVTEEGALDSATLRRVLRLDEDVVSSYDPAVEADYADRLRKGSNGVSAAVVVLAGFVVVLVSAQARRIEQRGRLRDPDAGWWRSVKAVWILGGLTVVASAVWVLHAFRARGG